MLSGSSPSPSSSVSSSPSAASTFFSEDWTWIWGGFHSNVSPPDLAPEKILSWWRRIIVCTWVSVFACSTSPSIGGSSLRVWAFLEGRANGGETIKSAFPASNFPPKEYTAKMMSASFFLSDINRKYIPSVPRMPDASSGASRVAVKPALSTLATM